MVEMEAFTGKLHSYLISVGARIEELHTSVGKLDKRLTHDIEDQARKQAEATQRLDSRLTQRTQVCELCQRTIGDTGGMKMSQPRILPALAGRAM
jgi:hypothetical protein